MTCLRVVSQLKRRLQPHSTCHYSDGAAHHAVARGNWDMKRSVIAALGAAVIATLGVSSAAQASVIGFDFSALNGSITHDGTSLSNSTFLDLDDATLLVVSVGTDDASGLIALVDTVKLTAETSPTSSKIIYGSGPGPL